MPAANGPLDLDLAVDMATMREAAREAGNLALAYLNKSGLDVWDKGDDNPVTEADLAVNTLLARRLGGARGNYGWLSEETADDPQNRLPNRVWVVDPIDGTRAFIEGDPYWCVGLAVVDHGRAVAGVIYAPVFDQLFEARLSGGAYLNGEPIQMRACQMLEGCGMIASADLIAHPAWRSPWPSMTLARPKPNATLLRLAYMAAGHQDGALAMWRKFDWDLAAGTILLQEAGGVVTTHLGEAYQFNRRVPAQASLVAAGKDLHPLLIERTKRANLPDPQATSEDETLT